MKYQTNAVGHRVGASELPTRHPRHKPRRHFPPLILLRGSKLLRDISLFLLLSLSVFLLLLSPIPSHFPFLPSSPFRRLLLQRLTFICCIYLHLPFSYFTFSCPIEQSPHFFLMFSSLCLKITSLRTPVCISATSCILDEPNVDFIVMEKLCPLRIMFG